MEEWEFMKALYLVMGDYKCYLRIEELGTSEVYEVGWFHGIHPNLSSKTEFLKDINQIIKDKL